MAESTRSDEKRPKVHFRTLTKARCLLPKSKVPKLPDLAGESSRTVWCSKVIKLFRGSHRLDGHHHRGSGSVQKRDLQCVNCLHPMTNRRVRTRLEHLCRDPGVPVRVAGHPSCLLHRREGSRLSFWLCTNLTFCTREGWVVCNDARFWVKQANQTGGYSELEGWLTVSKNSRLERD